MNPQDAVPYDQPTSSPTPKVAAAGLGGAITSLILWLAKEYFLVEPPAEVGAAIATLIAFASAYFTQDRKPQDVVEVINKEETYYKG